MSYAPPTAVSPPGPRVGEVRAAMALDLLECDPAAVLSRPLGRRRGEKSAAQLARERYEEELRQAHVKAPDDLMNFDGPQAAASSAASAPAVRAPPIPAAPLTADAVSQQSGLWPGDIVMARYGPGGCFYRARVVRVYSSRGAAIVDVEWLRPQATSPVSIAGEFLCNAGGGVPPDESLYRQGLQVDVDLNLSSVESPSHASRRGNASMASTPASFTPALSTPASNQAVASTPASAGPLADLLDLDFPTLDAQAPVSSAAAAQPPTLQSATGLPLMSPGPPPVSVLQTATWPAAPLPPAAGIVANGTDSAWSKPQPESFDFVSQMMTQATDIQPGATGSAQGGV